MKIVKIYMIHPYVNCIEDLFEQLHIDTNKFAEFDFVWSKTPDYLIATEHIYSDSNYWNIFKSLYSEAKVAIFYGMECITGDLNVFDYVISFDKNHQYGDRVIRIPSRLFFSSLIFTKDNELVGNLEGTRRELMRKEEFCNFVYSNAGGHDFRERLFRLISQYKRVDSLGRFLNNKKIESSKYGTNWRSAIEESIELKKPYKFSIACENATYSGYVSEKIFSSLEAHTIPIYWGNPDIEDEINPDCFINCHRFESEKDLLERIREIDENDDLWIKMVMSRWLTEEQEKCEKEDTKKYLTFLYKVFDQPICKAMRRGEGFHPERYRSWFFSQGISQKEFQYNAIRKKWLKLITEKRKVADYFVTRGVSSIAVYGYGEFGKLLVGEIEKDNRVNIVLIIDQQKIEIENQIKSVTPSEMTDEYKAEIVVITLPHLFTEISNSLKKVIECPMISIEEIVSF